ncbi:MAG: hypothetical protein E6J34_02155 [Chloroflexi bacterium]|nr:MAG: hypothetical protein E6J34_02155 [Chloroflexota bacterium]
MLFFVILIKHVTCQVGDQSSPSSPGDDATVEILLTIAPPLLTTSCHVWHKAEYGFVSTLSLETLTSACLQLATKELGLPEQQEVEKQLEAVKSWLQRHRGWLDFV